MSPVCHLCGGTHEVRPYGEGRKHICLNCMTSTPDRRAEAKRQIREIFAEIAADGGVPMITDTGIVRAPAQIASQALRGGSQGGGRGFRN